MTMGETTINNKGIIYGLIDPRYWIIRYAGKSNQTLENRYYGHIVESRNLKRNSKKVKWMRELWALGLEPIPILLEYDIPLSRLSVEENYFISITKEECAAFGITCVNTTQGGEGAEPVSEETRRKIGIKSAGQQYTRRYYCNHNYFAKIDSAEKAYWMGRVIQWRMNIDNVKKQYTIDVGAPSCDREYLQAFLDEIEATYPIRESKGRRASGLKVNLSSRQMIKDIRKNENNIPPEFLKHYFLGNFDGYGSWTTSKYFRFQIGFRTIEMAELFQSIIMKKCELNKTNFCRNENDTQYCVVYGGGYQITKIFDWLYTDAPIFLSRKYNDFLPHRKYRQELPKELVIAISKDFNASMPIKKICKKYEISYKTMRESLIKHKLFKPRHQQLIEVTNELRNKILELHDQGALQKDITKQLNLPTGVAHRIIKQAGKQKHHRISTEIKQNVFNDFQNGIRKPIIAKKHGIGIVAVYKIIKNFKNE